MARTCLFKQRTCTKDRKEIGRPQGRPIQQDAQHQQAAAEQLLLHEESKAQQQDVWHLVAVSSSQEQDGCTTNDVHATVASPQGCPIQQDARHQQAAGEQLLLHEESKTQQQDVWHLVAVSTSQEQDDCTTKDVHATVASLLEWDEVSSEVSCEQKSKVHLQACS